MKRRVLSLIITLALCLNLCPVWVLAADEGGSLCSHHPKHTDECGYVPPASEQECTHAHDDGCYTTETVCIHEHTAGCYPDPAGDSQGEEPALCTHMCTQDSGCVTRTLSCSHEHDESCGYVPENSGMPCTFACRVCPIEELIGKLPASVSADNSERVQAQLSEIYALYDELTPDEQEQVNLLPCVSLLEQMEGLGAEVWSDGSVDGTISLSGDVVYPDGPLVISEPRILNTNGHTLTGTNSNAIQITESGELDLRGRVVSNNDAGVEVQAGCSLRVADSSTYVKGGTYALDIASDATVKLSAGEYFGKIAAIHTADGNFAALLEEGYAYFNPSGTPIPPADVAKAFTVIVGQCENHSKDYTHTPGTTEHSWICSYCGAEGKNETCTFQFDEDGTGACVCGNTLTIVVDVDSLGTLDYTDTVKPANGIVTITLDNGTILPDTDYTVSYSTRAEVGETDYTVTVTVTSEAYNGTFEGSYTVTKADQPVLEWTVADPVTVPYTGSEVTKDRLPVKINITSSVDLSGYLQYSYREQGSASYTSGLPTNVGTYEVVVTLPEEPVNVPDYQAASSAPITLIIEKIRPIVVPPAAVQPVFNGASQDLVTVGTLHSAAARDGVTIKFSESEHGVYTTDIPTGINAGDYFVWYLTEETDNYAATPATPVENVLIQRKPIEPLVILSQTSYQYDGEEKQPQVTVKDKDTGVVLLETEYEVAYQDNQNVGTAKVIVTDQSGGNYAITRVEIPFQITARTQEALSITNQPDTVTYGDEFTLGTSGGSGNGEITWKITAGQNVATVGEKSGHVTVIGHGPFTVQATKSGKEPAGPASARAADGANYEDATASVGFDAAKKPVTATVTAEDKDYNGNNEATVRAVVERSDLVAGDEITITGLTGTFDNAKAGGDKPVTVVTTGATITGNHPEHCGNHSEHYAISYSSDTTPVKATIRKAVAKISAAPVPAVLTYSGTEQALIGTAAAVDPASVVNPGDVQVEYALSEEGPYDTAFPKGRNAGAYTVWYRVQENNNYTGLAPASVPVTIGKKQVAPTIALDQDSFVYDGTAKEPVVTLTEADGTTVIPAEEYRVDYSDNVNVGDATVTVTANDDGNYTFTNPPVTKTFKITKKQAQVNTAPEAAGDPLTFSNRPLRLVTAGSGTGGKMVYSVGNPDGPYWEAIPTEPNAGEYTVYYKVAGDDNHIDSAVGSVDVTIIPKTVTNPTIELYDENDQSPVSFTYDGNPKTPAKIVVKDGSTVIDEGEYTARCSDNINAGKATVSITDNLDGNYTVTGSATFDIFTADIVFNPAPSAAVIEYDGNPHELLVPGKTSGGTVLYALNSETSAYTAAIPTGTDAGDYTVYYKVEGDKNHNDFAVQSVKATIQRKKLTAITIELTPPEVKYDGTVQLPQVTVKDGETVLPEKEYQWTCTPANPTDKGPYTITITDNPGGNYDLTGVTNNTATFTIGQAAQAELTIEDIPDSTIYGDTFTLTTSGGSVSDVAVDWTATGPATVGTNGEVEITGVGKVTITATNPGNQNYLPVSAQWTFTTAPKPVTASITVRSRDYNGTTDATVAAAGITTINGDTVTIDPDSITATFDTPTVGTNKTVTLDTSNVQVTGDDAAKYAITYPASVKADITVKNAGPVTVELSDIDLKTETDGSYYYEYDGSVKTPAVTVKDKDGAVIPESEYTFTYSNNRDASDTTATPPKFASVTVKAKAGGNYAFDEETVNFTIKKVGAVLTQEPSAKDLSYNGTEQGLVGVGTATGGMVVYALKNGDTEPADSAYSETIPQGTNAGTYTVYYKVRGDANHIDTEPDQVSVTIKRKSSFTPVIKLSQDSYEYTGTAHKPTVTVYDGTDKIDSCEYTVSYSDNINAGTATVTVSDNSGGNYIVNGTANFTITRKAPDFTAPTAETNLQYNGELQALVTAGVCHEGTVYYSVDNGNYSTAIPAKLAVGQYEIKYKVEGDANHSDVGPVSLGTVKIEKNTVTDPQISLSSNQFTFNNNQQKPVITVYDNQNRLIPEREYTTTITGTKSDNMVDVDIYTITIAAAANSNYIFQGDCTKTFEIVPADQETISITGAKAQIRYGEEIQLGTTGGMGGSKVTWKIEGHTDTTLTQSGLLTVKDVNKTIKVTATRSAGDNYKEVSATWEFTPGKKPVTAVLTADDRDYTNDTDKSATVNASVPNSELVPGDSITITGLTGTFDDTNVGTDKKVTVNSTNPTVSGTNWEKYDITYPATTTASILAVAATVDTDPTPNTSLTYDAGQAQELLNTPGTATGGSMVYSLNDKDFSPGIPNAKDAGTYKVWYKVQGDQNHTDSAVGTKDVTIAQQTVTAQITLDPPSEQYDGKVKRPQVTARDGANHLIPDSEYTVVYDPAANWTDVGNHTVTLQNSAGGNYIVSGSKIFAITTTAQNELVIHGPDRVYYGDTFTLSVTGGSSGETVEWNVPDAYKSIAEVDGNGFVTIKGTGPAEITAKRAGGANYDDATATYRFNALKKPVTAIVTAKDREYKRNDTTAELVISWKEGALVGADTIDTSSLAGTFADDSAGTNKEVTIRANTPDGNFPANDKYEITIPPTTTATIFKATAEAPVLTANNRVYDGTTQPLVTGGNAGTTLYSNSQDGVYSGTVPQGTNAGDYTVWYKEQGDANHNASAPQGVTVTISPMPLTVSDANIELSGSGLQKDANGYYYAFDGTEKRPTVTVKDGSAVLSDSEYTVRYSDNIAVSTDAVKATVTVVDAEGGNYQVSGSITFEIRKGGAQLTERPQKIDLTYNGQEQALVTPGAASGGHIEYAVGDTVSDGDYKTDVPTETAAGTYTVHYRVVADSSHNADSSTAGSVSVTIRQKEITSPKITVSGTYTYNGSALEPGTANVKVEDGSTTIPASEYDLSYQNNKNAGTATVIVTNANGGNYIVNGTATFEIGKAAPTFTAPTGKTGLKYNGQSQELVTAGSTPDGTMVYSLSETGEYTAAIPIGKEVKANYTVWYKVQGDDNHEDSVAQSVPASIVVNNVTNPIITVTPPKATFNGEKQEPTVTVTDRSSGLVIDGSEYTVAYSGDMTNVGTHTLTITGKTDGNYTFTAGNTATFEILPAGQTPLTITGTRERVYYGDKIPLDTTGGVDGGTVTWSVGGSTIAEITSDGLLKITGVGSVTVTATSEKTGYTPETADWKLYAYKKPATAIVTAADRAYTGDTTATLSVTISGLVSGEDVTGVTATGHFADKNVGTNKTVIVDSITFPENIKEKYDIPPVTTTTAEIFKADVDETKVVSPKAVDSLEYTGLPQNLVTAGSSPDGVMEYSTDNITYSTSLPTGTAADDYEVWYRVKGDGNHNDMAAKQLAGKVNIAQQVVADPTIEFNPTGASYDGKEHKPAVTVKDTNKRVIPDSEYDVSYGDGDWTKAGTYKVKVTNKTGGNYNITEKEQEFIILVAGQSPLTITNIPGGKIKYGDSFALRATGGSGTGAVSWSSSDTQVASITENGLVEVHKSGSVTITARKLTDGGYGETTDTWSFNAEKKTVTPIVTAKDREFDPDRTDAQLVIKWQPGDLVNGDTLTLNLTGTFDSPDVGTDKEVTITDTTPASDKYDIKIPASTTASIIPKAASVAGSTPTELTYNGSAQPLVGGNVAATNGTLAYSLDGSYYTQTVPTRKDTGTYPVWYKAQASGNYKDSPAVRLNVTIEPKTVTILNIVLTQDTFDYDGTAKEPGVVVKDGDTVIPASEYTVSYSNNVQVGTNATVTISNRDGGNYNVSGSKTFTIKAATASLVKAPEPKDLEYTGRALELVTAGIAANGEVVYSKEQNGTYTTSIPREINAGEYEVWYKLEGDENTKSKSVTVTIQPKQIDNPTILLNGQLTYSTPYTGSPITPTVTVIVDGQQLTGNFTFGYSNNTNADTTATVTVQSTGGNYKFFAVTTFEITKGKATFFMKPQPAKNLVYTGKKLPLIAKAGAPEYPDDGIVLYSVDGSPYSSALPTGLETGSYVVFAKVEGNAAYEDSDVVRYLVEIGINEVASPIVELSDTSFSYTGKPQKPSITVSDGDGNVISTSEYKVTYTGDTVNPGTYTLTITSREINYSFAPIEREITILAAGQTPLTITGKPENVCYGDTLRLGADGGSGDGAVTWTATGPVDKLGDGQFKVTRSGSVKITATKTASGSYGESTAEWEFYANPKPVNAIVAAASKVYNGNTKAELTVTISSSGLVGSDTFTVTAEGHFTDGNVGTDKTVVIDSLTIPDDIKEKYDVKYPDTVTASITPKPAAATGVAARTNLTYTGSPLPLVTGGTPEGGTILYSVDNGRSFAPGIPTGTDAGRYTVWYKVVANDDNYRDSGLVQLETEVEIAAKEVTSLKVVCTPGTFPYDGTEKTPAVVIKDQDGNVIPNSACTVTLPSGRIEAGTYTVTVTGNPGGNYRFTAPSADGTFEITAASQNTLSIVTSETTVYYGGSIRLTAMGISGSGAIHWSVDKPGVARVESTSGHNCVVKVVGTGGFTVEAYQEAQGSYGQSNTDVVVFEAKPKLVTPVVTADNKPYDGNANAKLHASWPAGAMVEGNSIDLDALVLTGTFDSATVGTNKRVTFTPPADLMGEQGNYFITWPKDVMASIDRVDVKPDPDNKPAAADLTYTGSAQTLLANGGKTIGEIGTIEYKLGQNGGYSSTIPTATNAGRYEVWYRVADSVNYMGFTAGPVVVEIKRADPTITANPTASGTEGQTLSQISLNGGATDTTGGTFTWKDGSIKPGVGTSQQTVIFTPTDTVNYNTVEFQIDVTISSATSSSTPSGGGSAGTNSTPTQTSVIKPEVSSDGTKAQFSIPASTMNQIKNEDCTVSTPVANVTLPQAALNSLSSAGGTVDVVAEQKDQTVTLTLTANGEKVENVPGGITVSVPAEDAGPGTVAVLVNEDGTRETIRKSTVEDGKMNIPLSGSATVEIVDNSKEFTDVPPDNWASDAVAFASAHELFNGTSETTFSPDQPMSRGMLATVLYNLEGQPERDLTMQDLTDGYSDVSGDAWYADGVAWAAENGIASGYGNGEFGPNDSITREQFAVMLWKYAGSPEAKDKVLTFTDADQASGYAQEALCWAVENGIMSGYTDGQLAPGGTATRAQAAQMLKKFMENI